jgi:hypothetical protein
MATTDIGSLLGCSSIHGRVEHNPLLKPYLEELVKGGGVYGQRPKKMPNPSLKTIESFSDPSPVRERVGEAKATYIEVRSLSRYGVYFSALALFDNNMWYTVERNGAEHLRVFKEGFE